MINDIYREKEISGCGLSAYMDESGRRSSGDDIIQSIALLHDRSNGLGGGFAAYGIYPEFSDSYALHLFYDDSTSQVSCEELIHGSFRLRESGPIPTRKAFGIGPAPIIWRYFVDPKEEALERSNLSADDFVVQEVMRINKVIKGAFVFSSGKNMGAFKAVGFPEDVGDFYRLDEYRAYMWIAHGRFPTNTPGWWGGAHPFTILDWAIVHNGEISSYGINKRYVEMFGYHCTMMTDTEVMAYLFDLLLRKHGLPVETACAVIAPPFWDLIEHMPEEEKNYYTTLRMVYGSAMANGPFAIVLGSRGMMLALNDRVKLRPLVAARKGSVVYVSSEESGIREICPRPDSVWMPRTGEPVIARLSGEATQ
ncbi:MAG: hypothetical protein DSY91_04955 [Deltaproteobacteria bacterium]|nr:MAG: hypothetical protein DSY91_04955 [Deltaproteobacteria bacterium]